MRYNVRDPHSSSYASRPQRIGSGNSLYWAFLSCLLLFATPAARGQNTAVSGHIVDGAGEAIVNAQVDLANSATHEVIKTQTNGEGYFQFPPVAPGSYTAHANAPGFAPYTLNRVILEVGTTRLLDLTLSPAAQVQTVEVTAAVPELVTEQPDRGNVIESEFVSNIPLNIRNPLQMVNFAQGVTPYSNTESGNNDQSQAYTNTFRINGGKLATTESLLDGGANTTLYDLNAIAFVPQVDSISEFKVLTDAYAPEWGHTSGGVVTFSTKSGTDKLHGSTYDYLRNSYTDANNFNSNQTGKPKPHFERNQFGYALGGPVAFTRPELKGNHKTFFFSTYEGLRQSQAVLPSQETYTVPTQLERQGDFSQTFDSKGNLIVIYDPSTTSLQPTGTAQCPASTQYPAGTMVYCRQPFSGNKIPSQYLDTVGANLIKSYPTPNQAGTGLSSVGNYFVDSPTSSIQDTVNFRIDHRFSEKHSIFARFDWFQRYNYFGDPYRNNLSPTSNHQRLPGDNIMLDHTWVLSHAIVLEHHFVYAHQESNRIPEQLGYDPTKLGFAGSVSAGLPSTTFPAITSANRISQLGPQSGLEADGGTTSEYAASVTYLKGKHSLKFGVDYRYMSEDYHVDQLVSAKATSNFTGGPYANSPGTNSGSGIADLLLGTGTVTSGIVPGFHFGHPYYALYAQDEFRATPRLTLTYGVRYNLELPDIEAHNQFQYLDLTSPSPLNAQVTSLGTLTGGPGFVGVNGVGQSLQNTQHKNFDPRAGVAYRLNDRTVVRAGIGLFHAPSLDILGAGASQGYSAVTTSNPAQSNGVTPLYNMDNPFPSGLNPASGNSLGLSTNVGLSIAGYPRRQSVSYSEQWSLDVQRELPWNFVVTLGYVGNNGLHLYAPGNLNQMPDNDLAMGSALLTPVTNPFYKVITNPTSALSLPTVQQYHLLLPHPQFTTMTENYLSNGRSNYNAMQLSVERRFSQGLAILLTYTHSKMFDNVDDAFTYILGAGNQDNNCFSCSRSISGQDIPDVIRLSGQYDLPFGPQKAFINHGWPAQVVGGWSVGSFFTFDNGLPVQLTESNNTATFGGGSTMLPNAVPGVSTGVPGGRHIKVGVPAGTASEYFNPAAFSQATAYTFGNARRYIDSIRSPGTDNFDILAEKQVHLIESAALNFRVEFFNAFNRVQFAGPAASNGASIGTNTGAPSASFGYIVPTQANNPRSIQGSLRLSF
jgi:hypothetical protein